MSTDKEIVVKNIREAMKTSTDIQIVIFLGESMHVDDPISTEAAEQEIISRFKKQTIDRIKSGTIARVTTTLTNIKKAESMTVKQIKQDINQIFSNATKSKEEVVSDLEEIKEEVEILLDSLNQ